MLGFSPPNTAAKLTSPPLELAEAGVPVGSAASDTGKDLRFKQLVPPPCSSPTFPSAGKAGLL